MTSLGWKQFTSHRLAYFFAHGEQAALNVLHKCDNPPCCNPDHLFLGTTQDNTADMVEKGRQSKGEKHSEAILPNRPRGSENNLAKATEDQVVEMRRMYCAGTDIHTIATQFSMSFSGVQKIVRGVSWSHLQYTPPVRKAGKIKHPQETVDAIRAARQSGMKVKDIAHQFGISVFTCNEYIYRSRRP